MKCWDFAAGFWGMRSMERSLPNDHSSDNNKIFTGDINLCSFERFVMFQLGQSVR